MGFNIGDIVLYGYYMPTDPWFLNKAKDKGIIVKKFLAFGEYAYIIRGLDTNITVRLQGHNMEVLSGV